MKNSVFDEPFVYTFSISLKALVFSFLELTEQGLYSAFSQQNSAISKIIKATEWIDFRKIMIEGTAIMLLFIVLKRIIIFTQRIIF